MDPQKPKSQESGELSFRPITDGLGFHPFSDGLPYAPIAKSPRINQSLSGAPLSGLGAVAAGSPQPVFPQKPPPPRSEVVPQISVPIARPIVPSAFEKPLLSTSQNQSPSSSVSKQHYSFGYVLRRVMSCIVDAVLSTSVFLVLVRLLIWKEDLAEEVISNSSVIFVAGCLWVAFHWAWVTIQEMAFKSSLGKRMLGLRLRGSSILILLRSLFFIPSFYFFGIGLIWALFDPKKRCWHDRVVDIQPIYMA